MVVLGDEGVVAEELNGAHDQVIEVQRVGGSHAFVVLDVGIRNDARHWILPRSLAVARGANQLILSVRDARRHHLRRETLDIHVHCLEDHLDEALRVLGVVDRERGRQARSLVLVAQQAHARRVECRHPHASRVPTHERTRPLAHLRRRLVRECDRQDLPGPRAARGQQVGDTVGEHARLSGARARKNQQRRARVRDRLALAIVEAARERFRIHAGTSGVAPPARVRARRRLPRRGAPRRSAGDGDVGPAAFDVGPQRVLHVEGGSLRRNVVVVAASVQANQVTKVR